MNGGSRKTSYLNHFASADTIVPDPANPQAYNRYSYVYNNPIRFNDPSGHSGEDVIIGYSITVSSADMIDMLEALETV